ncbi:MAG: hypothetical protein JWO13_2265 [Acidobacteriales bacterium]|nr:hypothetical protein [Terriglobales bacterium]
MIRDEDGVMQMSALAAAILENAEQRARKETRGRKKGQGVCPKCGLLPRKCKQPYCTPCATEYRRELRMKTAA